MFLHPLCGKMTSNLVCTPSTLEAHLLGRLWGLCRSVLWGPQQGRVWTVFPPAYKSSVVVGIARQHRRFLGEQDLHAELVLCVLELWVGELEARGQVELYLFPDRSG